MSKYITFPSRVNQNVLDETTMTVGNGGFVEDKNSEGTFSQRRLTSLACPDKFNVVMYFDWSEKDEDGLSEFDRFINWYKYDHQRGVKPFQFKSLTKFGVNGTTEYSYYKITGNLSVQKSALAYKVSMEWTEVVNHAILIEESNPEIDHILCYPFDNQKIVYVYYSGKKKRLPFVDEVEIFINDEKGVNYKVIPSSEASDMFKFIFPGTWAKGLQNIVLKQNGEVKATFSMEVN